MKLYSTHCPRCLMVETILKQHDVPYELITDEDEIMKVADNNHIMGAPFAEIDGKIYNPSQLTKYLQENVM